MSLIIIFVRINLKVSINNPSFNIVNAFTIMLMEELYYRNISYFRPSCGMQS